MRMEIMIYSNINCTKKKNQKITLATVTKVRVQFFLNKKKTFQLRVQ